MAASTECAPARNRAPHAAQVTDIRRHAPAAVAPAWLAAAAVWLAAGSAPAAGAAWSNQLVQGVQTFREAYAAWDAKGFEAATASFSGAAAQQPESAVAAYWLAAGRYHVVLALLARSEDKEDSGDVRDALDAAVEAVKAAMAVDPDSGETHAMYSGLLGLKIGANRAASLWLGPRLLNHRKDALRKGADNPRVHLMLGTSSYHAPPVVGGIERSLEHLTRAKALYEQEASAELGGPLVPRWGYDTCLAFLARIYREQGRTDQALATARQALALNPGNDLAGNVLEAVTGGTGAPRQAP